MSGFWSIVVSEATTNYCKNPSAETTGNYAAAAGTTVTLSTTYARFGIYSYKVETNADNEGLQLTLQALTNAVHYVTMRVRGTLPAAWDWSLDNATYTAPTKLADYGDWELYGLSFTAAQSNASTTLYIYQNGAGSGEFYIDGVQVEQKSSYYTSYCDGTQEGCAWNGTAHGSSSTRSVQSLAGGRVYALSDYTAYCTLSTGIGMPNLVHNAQQYALLPGALYQGTQIPPRSMTLTFEITGSSRSNLHALRKALINLLKIDRVASPQPVTLLYNGQDSNSPVPPGYAIRCLYESGLGFGQPEGHSESVAIRFLCLDPFWFMWDGESSTVLDTNDSSTQRYISARINGAWSTTITPSAGALVNAILEVSPDALYITGAFTNWNGNANCDRVAKWNGTTWSELGVGADDTGVCLCVSPAGLLYVGGIFLNVYQTGGAAVPVKLIASWDGTTWDDLGPPNAAGAYTQVYAMTVDHSGVLWVGGLFTNFDNIANADYIVNWNGTAWSAPAVGADGGVYALTVGLDGTVYAGGNFDNIGGVACAKIAQWNGTTWAVLGTGMNASVNDLTIAPNGDLYAGGAFTTAGGVTVNYIARWNGTAWSALDTSINATVTHLDFGPDGTLYAGGSFTDAGGHSTCDKVARWNGSVWEPLDISPPAAVSLYSLETGRADPVVVTNYNIYTGHGTADTFYYSGSTTVTNNGTRSVYPRIIVKRTGGTTATLVSIRNETTGRELLFDYDLLAGETITIDLRETKKSISSDYRGNILGEILPGCDFATWALQPGANTVTAFVHTTGAPTITAYLLWTDQYWSAD